MEAVDVELEITSGGHATYLVVAPSPSGEAMATMRLPFDEEEIESQLQARQTTLLLSTAKTRRVVSEVEQPVRQLGAALFDALIVGDMRVLVGASRDRAAHEGKRLRLVLRIRQPELSRLPWEFLYNMEGDEYLALTMPLLRYHEVLEPRRALQASPPLEILGMVALPSDRDPLDVEEEQQWLEAALVDLERTGRVRLTLIEGQTWRDLQRAMRQGRWHVFHFIGHGGFDQTADEGIIALGISMDQLAGKVTYDLDLSGDWWCAWQTWKDGAPRIDTHPLEVHQRGEVLQLNAERAVPVAEGSYRWRGELRLWDNEALIGWYRSTDAAVRSKGALYLALHQHGEYAWGRWVGMSCDDPVVTGWGAIARTEEQAHKVVLDLINERRP